MNDMHLRKYIDVFPQQRVAVIGDLMLDRYIWGTASRISQEAPVPVVKVERETEAPGGAANVVANLLGLNGQAGAYGLVGDDAHGTCLRALLAGGGAVDSGIVVHPERRTTVKTRVICNHQQVVRIDHEDDFARDGDEWFRALKDRLCDDLEADRYDAVIFEDYAKGVLTPEFMEDILACASRVGVLTALDPHPSHPFNVKKLSLLTPNRSEAFALAGMYEQPPVMPLSEDRALLEVGRRLQENWNVQYLLVTLGGNGMALFTRDTDAPMHIPTRAKSVYDVSGAGDTVTASFMLALLAGASPREAAQIANHAAGIVVGKVGTLPVNADELLENLKEHYESDQ